MFQKIAQPLRIQRCETCGWCTELSHSSVVQPCRVFRDVSNWQKFNRMEFSSALPFLPLPSLLFTDTSKANYLQNLSIWRTEKDLQKISICMVKKDWQNICNEIQLKIFFRLISNLFFYPILFYLIGSISNGFLLQGSEVKALMMSVWQAGSFNSRVSGILKMRWSAQILSVVSL